jgi:PilZ domain
MVSLSLVLEPDDLLSGWRPDSGRLLLPVPSAPRLQEKVAVRVQLEGRSAGATVRGTAVSIHRYGSLFRLELAPDLDSLGAVRLLVAAAKGELVEFPARPPRFLARLPVRVRANGAELLMTTSCISEGGCALRWSGPPPRVGDSLRLRIGAGSRAAEVEGVVAWRNSASGAGIRFVTPGNAWRALFAEAQHSGAPRA